MTFRPSRLLPFLRAWLPFFDAEDNPVAIVLGTGRSGTTWLAEQLAHASLGRIIFEPLHPVANPGRDWVGVRRYLRPDDPAPEWRVVLDTIVGGQVRSRWTDRYNARLQLRGSCPIELGRFTCQPNLMADYPILSGPLFAEAMRHLARPSRVSRADPPQETTVPDDREFAARVVDAFDLADYRAPLRQGTHG